MARWRVTFDTSVWSDPRTDMCGITVKAMHVYLCANNAGNRAGLYRLSLKTMANDLEVSAAECKDAFDRLVALGVVEWDASERIVYLPGLATLALATPAYLRGALLDIESLPGQWLDRWANDNADLLTRWEPPNGAAQLYARYIARLHSAASRPTIEANRTASEGNESVTRTREASPEPTRTLPASNSDDDFDPLDLEPGVTIERAVGIAATMWRNDPSPAAAIALELHTEYAAQCARKGATAVRPGGCIETLIRLVLWAHRNKEPGEDTATVCKRMVLHSLTDEWSGGGKYLTSPAALWGGRDQWAEKLGKLEADSRKVKPSALHAVTDEPRPRYRVHAPVHAYNGDPKGYEEWTDQTLRDFETGEIVYRWDRNKWVRAA